jgi:hypothetical protein
MGCTYKYNVPFRLETPKIDLRTFTGNIQAEATCTSNVHKHRGPGKVVVHHFRSIGETPQVADLLFHRVFVCMMHNKWQLKQLKLEQGCCW